MVFFGLIVFKGFAHKPFKLSQLDVLYG